MNGQEATARPARPPRRLRAPAPPLDLVALAALDLPAGVVADYLSTVPVLAPRIRRLRALHHLDELARDLPVGVAERLTGLRYGVSTRSLRRWRRGL